MPEQVSATSDIWPLESDKHLRFHLQTIQKPIKTLHLSGEQAYVRDSQADNLLQRYGCSWALRLTCRLPTCPGQFNITLAHVLCLSAASPVAGGAASGFAYAFSYHTSYSFRMTHEPQLMEQPSRYNCACGACPARHSHNIWNLLKATTLQRTQRQAVTGTKGCWCCPAIKGSLWHLTRTKHGAVATT